MKNFICQAIVSVATFFIIVVFLAMGVQAEEKECIDVSGTWDATDEIDASNCGGSIRTRRHIYDLIQNDCIVILKRKGEKDIQAEVRGNKIYWPKLELPGKQAGSTVILEEGVSRISGNRAIGERHWTWTKGKTSCSGKNSWIDIKQRSEQTKMPSTVPSSPHRDKITTEDLWADRYKSDGPVHNDYFMPFGNPGPALHKFSGTLVIASADMTYQYIWARGSEKLGTFPALKTNFFTYHDHLVPIERNKLLKSEKSSWYIILAPGRIWSEPGDKGYSRASFPFTIIYYRSLYGETRNGIATFLFNDRHVSKLRFQIIQEAAPQVKFDAWGQADMQYVPAPLSDEIALTQQFIDELAHQTPIRPWTELERTYDPKALDVIDGTGNRENITLSGLIIDDAVYARTCRTRYGDYPYCSQMRHGVYSVSKSLGAMVAMLRLAQKYGDEIFDLKIKDYVDLASNHDGWSQVTFGDTLNMATGIGNVEPRRASSYVDEDSSALAEKIYAAQTTDEKLKLIAAFGNYPWGPGEVFRYRTTDTFLLAVAMDRFIKSKEGPNADLWSLMTREVLQPIGIKHMPVMRTEEANHIPGIPKLEGGMLPNLDEVAKLVKLLRDGGRHQEKQILSATKLDEVIDNARPPGLPTGWQIDDGETNYHMSLWLHPFVVKNGCLVRIPAMSGLGGTYVILIPNGITAFRFADGRYNDPGTWDSSGLRKVADYIRPLCNKHTD